jgi:hypothetical protein
MATNTSVGQLDSASGANELAKPGDHQPDNGPPNEADGTGQIKPDAKNLPSSAHGADDSSVESSTDSSQSEEDDDGTTHKHIKATGSGVKNAIKSKKPAGGFDKTPLPDAPQGYTVRFTFHYATNLAAADFSTASSDPFLTATLKAANPKRHEEDPNLVHRTRTIKRTTEPKWNEEWVVANVPPSGFTLKCRLYDEDSADHDDRLGNVTIKIPHVDEQWEGIAPPGKEFEAKKRMMSKRAFLVKGISTLMHSDTHLAPRLCISIEVLGKSNPPFAQMYTVGPTAWTKHFSPMIGRLTGTKVNKNEEHDQEGGPSQTEESSQADQKKSQKYE